MTTWTADRSVHRPDPELPRCRRHRHREPLPRRGRRWAGAGRRRPLPRRRLAAASELDPVPRSARQSGRGGAHPCSPRPLRLPAAARQRGIPRSHRQHSRHRRSGRDRPARQRPPPGGGRPVGERGRLVEAPAGLAAVRQWRRGGHLAPVRARRVRRPCPADRRRGRDTATGRAHPRVVHRGAGLRRAPRGVQWRPRPRRPSTPAAARPAAGGRHAGRRVHLRRPAASGAGPRRAGRRRTPHRGARRHGPRPGVRGGPDRAGAARAATTHRPRTDSASTGLRRQPDGASGSRCLPRGGSAAFGAAARRGR